MRRIVRRVHHAQFRSPTSPGCWRPHGCVEQCHLGIAPDPALVMDELADGRLVVFVPASPAPMSGAVYVFAPDKVTYLNVPLLPFLKVISSWGLGLREIIEAQASRGLGQAADHLGFAPATLSSLLGLIWEADFKCSQPHQPSRAPKRSPHPRP